MYDFLIVGAGLYGSTFAHLAKQHGQKSLIIDRRNHIGGNCYTQEIAGIQKHCYGPHIFSTNSEKVWEFVNQFAHFEQYAHRVRVNFQGRIYSFPINLMTLYQLWGCTTPAEANQLLESKRIPCEHPRNLKEWVMAEVGQEIFETFYEGYSSKLWMANCEDIPCSVGKRLPIRMTYDDRYHEHQFSGIPANGDYTAVFHQMLEGTEVQLNTDLGDINWQGLAKTLVYTGSIDELFGYCFGPLEYRGLQFETEVLNTDNFQGVPQINYTEAAVPYTRIIEHKWFSPRPTTQTVVTKEFPLKWEVGRERFYPVHNDHTQAILQQYREKARENNILVGGRLGSFKYLDMDACVGMAMKDFHKLHSQ